jgi:ADP-L-glycero-D-manno-heptose 6-epimerase
MSSHPLLLVTGAAGFIGARFVASCTQRGYSTVSVDSLPFFQSRAEHRGLDFGERVDRSALFDWLASRNPALSGIVHLGACTDTTELDVAYLQSANLHYSQQLWRYAAERRVPLVYASSAATYGDGSLGYDDDESLAPQLKPLNPYGQSKLDFDLWALQQESAGMSPPSWSGFKFFNVYGFGERHKGKMASVVLHAFDQICATGRVRLFKSHRPDIPHGHQKRDFIYVDDVVSGLHFALEKPIRRGIFNLGTGQARTFLDLAVRVS